VTTALIVAATIGLLAVWLWHGRTRLFRVAAVTALVAAPCAVMLGNFWLLGLFAVAMYVARSVARRPPDQFTEE